MKKIYMVFFAMVISFAVAAQDAADTAPVLKSKKGENYLPETGEWGLGISGNAFFGILSGNNSGVLPGFNFVSNPPTNLADNFAVFGKYMVDEKTAYRVRFNVTTSSRKDVRDVIAFEPNFDPAFPKFTTDSRKSTNTLVMIAAGLEKRRGSTRLQGIYGGEVVLGYGNSKSTYEYGNPIEQNLLYPTFNFDGNAGGTFRVSERDPGGSFLIGARGFIGVEYFIIPKLSVGGEFGYMLSYQATSNGTETTQTWDGASSTVRTTKTDVNNGGFTSLGIGLDNLDNLNGSINILFYF